MTTRKKLIKALEDYKKLLLQGKYTKKELKDLNKLINQFKNE